VIVDGLPLTGVAGYAGEVGHMPINPNGTACRCGSIGCWETEVGEAALLRLAGRPTGGGSAGVDAVMREAAAGSPAALSALDHVGRWLGIGLAGLINIFDPELIVLGGTFGRVTRLSPTCSRRSWTGVRWPGRAGSSGSSWRSSARMRRCSGSRARVRAVACRPGGLAAESWDARRAGERLKLEVIA
jgi:predicted NBD/HSP70 family sugar kinase